MLIYLYSKNILRVFHRKRKAYMPLPKPAACWAQKETNKRNLDCFSEENDSGSKSGNGNGHGNGTIAIVAQFFGIMYAVAGFSLGRVSTVYTVL